MAKKRVTKKRATKKKVTAIKHGKQSRPNIPTAEMEELVAEEENQPLPVQYRRKNNPQETPELYRRDHDLDPQLVWIGKDEEDEEGMRVDAVPIYTQEKIRPQTIIDDLRRRTAEAQPKPKQGDLFADDFGGIVDENARVEFYRHQQKWTNRMILGDSLLVMASLAHKEGLKGKVQCIYIDPPYGIKFSSNWQVSTKSTEVKDKDESRESEVIQAFRDTWQLGINSYLSYLRDRLRVARDLLTESGSVFVQIGDENVHSVGVVMDEIFGTENRMATISFATTSGSSASHLSQVADYLLWYAKNKEFVKYQQLYEPLSRAEIIDYFNWDVAIELPDGSCRKLTAEERRAPDESLPEGARVYRRTSLDSQGVSTTGRSDPYQWNGRVFHCGANRQWSISKEGMDNIRKAGRLQALENQDSLMWKKYENEVPGRRINNLWPKQMYPSHKHYVVETSTKVIQRCILMTTDPGDLVLDPTCGSGATATVAEQWGRRWITIDTSRVALALARARLMGNKYDYYLMQDSEEGARKEAEISGKPATKKQYTNDVRHGFVYHRVDRISPNGIANNKEIDVIWDKWQAKLEPLREKLNAATGKAYQEWEVPHDVPDGEKWNKAAREAHAAWWQGRRARQKEMDISVASNAETEYLVDRPYIANNTVRVTGPFTMESLSPHRILPTDAADAAIFADEDAALEAQGKTPPERKSRKLRPKSQTENEARFTDVVLENLKTSGVQNTRKNERLTFTEIQPWANGRRVQYYGVYEENGKSKKAALTIGPEYGTVTRSFLIAAAREAADMFDLLVVLGFAFEAHASEKMINVGKLPVMLARMNNDLHMGDRLQKGKSGNLFVAFGEPDIECRTRSDGMMEVEIHGVDIFDPTTGEVTASGVDDVACWMIDTDYNEESFFVRRAYFTGGGKDPYKQLKNALNDEINHEAWASLYRAVSHPFPKPKTGKIAVKAINHYGDEVIKIFDV